MLFAEPRHCVGVQRPEGWGDQAGAHGTALLSLGLIPKQEGSKAPVLGGWGSMLLQPLQATSCDENSSPSRAVGPSYLQALAQ